MAIKNKAYLDTSAFIALIDSSDSHHFLFRRLFANPPHILTSPLVLSEGHAWFLRRYDRDRALQFMSFIEALTPLKVIDITHADIQDALKILRKFPDQTLTLTDGVGLMLMKRLKVNECWSTDRHLALTGMPLVIHQK